MKFKSILSRLTGLSTPVFGVSWNPPKSERAVARKVLAFLEDRRVLYNPSELEMPDHCVQSVVEIRHFLTAEITEFDADAPLGQDLRAMRAACRKFLDMLQGRRGNPRSMIHWAGYDSWVFSTALGELRGVVGLHVGKIAVQYGIDVEGELAKILPAPDDDAA